MTDPAPAVLGPAARPPTRRPDSVRRTSTLLMTWPDGIFSGLRLEGRCRDLRTGPGGRPEVLGQSDLVARTTLDRTIESITAPGAAPDLSPLAGARAGGRLRSAIADVAPGLRERGDPLYLLLDDLAGSSLIAGFAWFRWRDHLPELARLRDRMPRRSMQGICSGFRPGASSLNPDGSQSDIGHAVAAVPPLIDPDDPIGWHELPAPPQMAMRRARRIDVWREGDTLHIDAMFRDGCWEPDGTEIAVHEYQVLATAGALDGRLLSVEALPRVLPFTECPLAAPNVTVLEGVAMPDLREVVLDRLKGVPGCTHLNDALRALAEVPVLAAALERDTPARGDKRLR
ncbi:DUF2889 domain-containing protein [Actinomadura sp. SCN-SB]|uniref:DUF2889 domain-containing protein n=1 Tax=Actinomadura sp. SCN-SB TaxID=3373092 RepID=UPI0037527823